MRLLIVEDDPDLASVIARGLREHAYAVDVVGDGAAAVVNAAINEYDAIVLDVLLPKQDGFSVARTLRRRGIRSPILMLTARDAVRDRVEGLDAGADDYLVKPFAFEELLARLRAVMRRATALQPTIITVGDIAIDTGAQRVLRRGQVVAVTSKEFALLEYLARRAGKIVSRAEITAHVWDDNHFPLSNTIEVFIRRLRRKLGDSDGGSLIQTRRGAGYILVPPDVAS